MVTAHGSRSQAHAASPIAQALFSSLFDYAGLFPPANLGMQESVANFVEYRDGPYAWMLNRFVLPASRLGEFLEVAKSISGPLPFEPLELSLIGGPWDETLDFIREFQVSGTQFGKIGAIETREPSPFLDGEQMPWSLYQEVAWDSADAVTMADLQKTGAFAKMRTGGVDEAAFPRFKDVSAFLAACTEVSVPCKATAGLHHPLPSRRAASSQTEATVVQMHGFLNVILAATATRQGANAEQVCELLQCSETTLQLDETLVRAGDWTFTVEEIVAARSSLFHSIGSCSFTEPIDDLLDLGWL